MRTFLRCTHVPCSILALQVGLQKLVTATIRPMVHTQAVRGAADTLVAPTENGVFNFLLSRPSCAARILRIGRYKYISIVAIASTSLKRKVFNVGFYTPLSVCLRTEAITSAGGRQVQLMCRFQSAFPKKAFLKNVR